MGGERLDEVRLGSRTLQPRRQLLVAGRREPIGKRALDILSVLAEARGAIVTKDELLEAVWPGVTVEENALQVHIVALRKALGPEAARLRTIRGVGYQLEIDGESAAQAVTTDAAPSASPPPSGPAAPDRPATSKPAVTPAALWTKAKAHRLALAVTTLLLVLVGAWAVFGDNLGLRPRERIPVVVRELTATTNGDPTEAALANGITDELIDRLRRIPELRVATVEADRVVQDASFSNAYVIDGSIRRSGEQLRVMTRLSDAKGEVLWSQTFDRRLVELLDMQQRIAASIADALSISFDVGTDSTAYGGTDNPEAYAAFLEANANLFNPDQTVPQRLLERALAIDPDYIQALALQSFRYQIRINSTLGLTREQAFDLLAEMDESSKRALAANPNLWIGHAARGAYFYVRKDYGSAQRSLRRLAELDLGNEPGLRSQVAGFEASFGRVSKALALFESAELVDPVGRHNSGKVGTLMGVGRLQEAIDLAKAIAAGDPVLLRNISFDIFWSHLALGQEDEAIRHSEQYLPAFAEGLRAFRADKALTTMSPATLRQWAGRRYGAGGGVILANVALFAGYEGHPKLAVELMRMVFERPSGGLLFMLWNPVMAEARKTDEFEKLVTDLGLVKVWRESGDWGDFCRPLSATEITCT